MIKEGFRNIGTVKQLNGALRQFLKLPDLYLLFLLYGTTSEDKSLNQHLSAVPVIGNGIAPQFRFIGFECSLYFAHSVGLPASCTGVYAVAGVAGPGF